MSDSEEEGNDNVSTLTEKNAGSTNESSQQCGCDDILVRAGQRVLSELMQRIPKWL